MINNPVTVRFVSSGDWGDDAVTGTLRYFDDDLVQVEVETRVDVPTTSVLINPAAGGASQIVSHIVHIPWTAIRSMDPA